MRYRMWSTGVDSARLEEYRAFARTRSLPMFRQQPGFVDVAFLCDGHRHHVLTIWQSEEDIARLAMSPTYQSTARDLAASGVLTGEQAVRVLLPEIDVEAIHP